MLVLEGKAASPNHPTYANGDPSAVSETVSPRKLNALRNLVHSVEIATIPNSESEIAFHATCKCKPILPNDYPLRPCNTDGRHIYTSQRWPTIPTTRNSRWNV